tara:strand:- start:122 stop:406 length:285 start_codon:yes stop_codon:yes gene_type:complete
MGADPLKLANPTKATRAIGKLSAKARKQKKDLDKKKKALVELREHKKLGWDGKGSKKPDLQLRGNIMWPTKESKKNYNPWKRKLDRLEKKLKGL